MSEVKIFLFQIFSLFPAQRSMNVPILHQFLDPLRLLAFLEFFFIDFSISSGSKVKTFF